MTYPKYPTWYGKEAILGPCFDAMIHYVAFLAFILLIALVIAPQAQASTEVITLEDPFIGTPNWDIGASVTGGDNRRVYLNFDSIGIPNEYAFFSKGSAAPGPAPDQSGTFELKLGTNTIATGTYQFDNGTFFSTYTEMILLNFDTWEPMTYTGCMNPNITFTPDIPSYREITGYQQGPTAGGYQNCGGRQITWDHSTSGAWYNAAGSNYFTYESTSTDTITATNLTKISNTMLLNSDIVKSGSSVSLTKIYSNNSLVYTGTTGFTDESVVSVGADVIFSMYVPATGHTINSTVKFLNYFNESGGIPPVTPTPTPSGSSRVWFTAVNGVTSGAIYGANIQITDDTTGLWSNSTADADGSHYIFAAATDTVSGYADATGFTTSTRTGVTAAAGPFEIIMWPTNLLAVPGSGGSGDPGLGNVNLIVIVNDITNNKPLQGASVSATTPAGTQQIATTNSAGTVTMSVPNVSTIHLTVAKTGYTSGDRVLTTSSFGPDTTRMELVPITIGATATATAVLTNANGDVVVTIMPGCEGGEDTDACYAAQDRSMMNDVRGWMKLLIPLFAVFTIVYLVMGMGRK